MPTRSKRPLTEARSFEICILAGGLSTRMGRDKARVRLGRTTMLAQVKRAASPASSNVRLIRRDLVPRCGPIGGIYTALKSTRAERVLFLPCDMPFISREILDALLVRSAREPERSVFVRLNGELTFPMILPRVALKVVASQIGRGSFSLQALGRKLRARVLPARSTWKPLLQNINTQLDLERAGAGIGKGSAF